MDIYCRSQLPDVSSRCCVVLMLFSVCFSYRCYAFAEKNVNIIQTHILKRYKALFTNEKSRYCVFHNGFAIIHYFAQTYRIIFVFHHIVIKLQNQNFILLPNLLCLSKTFIAAHQLLISGGNFQLLASTWLFFNVQNHLMNSQIVLSKQN